MKIELIQNFKRPPAFDTGRLVRTLPDRPGEGRGGPDSDSRLDREEPPYARLWRDEGWHHFAKRALFKLSPAASCHCQSDPITSSTPCSSSSAFFLLLLLQGLLLWCRRRLWMSPLHPLSGSFQRWENSLHKFFYTQINFFNTFKRKKS